MFVLSGDRDFKFGRYKLTIARLVLARGCKPSLKGTWLCHVNVNHFLGANDIYGMYDRLRCFQLRWTMSVVNWWRSRSPVYHTDRRCLCTTRWAWGNALYGSGDCSVLFFSRAPYDGWPHRGCTFSIFCRMSFWLTLPRGVVGYPGINVVY